MNTNQDTERKAEAFASMYKTSFGRSMTTTDAKVYLRELRAACGATDDEIRAAMRTVSANMLDDSNVSPPTVPALAREIRHIRGRAGRAGDETFSDAVAKIEAEPDQSLRWSMFCNRGGSDALRDALASRGVEMMPFGPKHPDWPWAIALAADDEWNNIRRNMEQAHFANAHNRETTGEKLGRMDSFSRGFREAFGRQVAKRSAEGWEPPPRESLSPMIQSIMGSMEKAMRSQT